MRPHLLDRVQTATAGYPRQFWVLFWGLLISSAGGSMVWPFLTIYMHQRLEVSLTTVTLLFTLNAAAGLVSTSLAGPAVDRFGRKRIMALSLATGGLTLVAMGQISTLGPWAILMILNGLFGSLYGVGSNAMVADMVEPERRAGSYALLRMGNNLGVAIGPAVGGFVTSTSYTLAFSIAAGANFLFFLLVLLAVRETLSMEQETTSQADSNSGYGPVLRDRPFLAFCGVYTLAMMPSVLLVMLLPVYAKENFGVPESQYGFIMATNAAMVVLFQYAVTRVTQRYRHLSVMALGAFVYALGVGSIAMGRGFWAFWASMVVVTVGELVMVPTATALTANLAPADMRGRYMGLYGITWSVAFGIGPVIGGFLNDHVAPVAIWYGGLAIGLAATLGFLLLRQRLRRA